MFSIHPMIKFNLWVGLTLYKKTKTLHWSKFKAFADNKINVTKILKFTSRMVKNILGKKRKCWLPAFSPVPKMFSKASFHRVVESRDCVVKGLFCHLQIPSIWTRLKFCTLVNSVAPYWSCKDYPINRRQNFRLVQIETNCRWHFEVNLKWKINAI